MKLFKFLCFSLLVISVLLTSCATQPTPEAFDPPGFFTGFWNGLTIPFALIGHLFDSSIRIYAFPNDGGWYDFGYFLGAAAALGGGASTVANSDDSDVDSDDSDVDSDGLDDA